MTKAITKDDHIYLVDGSGYIFRAYHALPPLTRNSDGLPVGAVAGFCNMLAKLLDEETDATHIAIIFDASGTSFRNDIYADYKANRDEPPEDLRPQFALVRAATRAFNLPSIELLGYEADDLIATYTEQAAAAGAAVTIVSSDKDLMQLVGGRVRMLDTMKQRVFGVEEVQEKFGVPPNKVVEVQALAGDSSDNVPGVPGIGIKTAAELINHYGDVETLLANAGEIKQNKRRENLIEFANQARVSRELVYLKRDTPCPVPLAEMQTKQPDGAALIGFLKAMAFNSITKRMAKKYGFDADEFAATPDKDIEGFDFTSDILAKTKDDEEVKTGATKNTKPTEKITKEFEIVDSVKKLKDWVARGFAAGVVAVDCETDGLDAMACRLVGISLAIEPDNASDKISCYIPLAHESEGLLGERGEQIDLAQALAILAPLLSAPSVLKIFQNAKFDCQIITRHLAPPASPDFITPLDDTMLIAYALYGGAHNMGMDELSERYLNHKPIAIKTLLGSGKSQISFDKVPIDKASEYAAEDAEITLRLWQYLKPQLAAQKLVRVYESTERPLVPIVCTMERCGILIDKAKLARLSAQFIKEEERHAKIIYELAGEQFNIASPKQLGAILFDKLKLDGGKKTKGGAKSTDVGVLEDLAHSIPATKGSQLAAEVLAWRSLAKLRSTYTDALPGYINAESGRVHTSYSLASTTTGRFSSSEPNLQNIPIRTEMGREIRTCFIAPKSALLVAADYSQIELRVLAHMADIAALKSAFAEGLDIHAMTAAEIFNVPLKSMDGETRRRAKAINFGIIYGISAFGLAKQLDIGRGEAADYIKSYFAKFPGIRDYMEATKEAARAAGYVETLFGRRVHLREIDSKSAPRRAFAERAAINAPIQGTAADIIRRAMVALPPLLAENKETKMLLQVHDELVFEIPEKIAEKLTPKIKEIMESACAPRLKLSVPLVVDIKSGKNW